jgi:hypothetical protein
MRIQVVIEEDMSTLHLLRKLRRVFGNTREGIEINIESRPMPQAIWSEVLDRILFAGSQAAQIIEKDIDWGVYVTTDTFNRVNEKGFAVSQEELLTIAIQSRDGRKWLGTKNISERQANPRIRDDLHNMLTGVVLVGATDPRSTDLERAILSELAWTIYEAACSAPKITHAMSATMT